MVHSDHDKHFHALNSQLNKVGNEGDWLAARLVFAFLPATEACKGQNFFSPFAGLGLSFLTFSYLPLRLET